MTDHVDLTWSDATGTTSHVRLFGVVEINGVPVTVQVLDALTRDTPPGDFLRFSRSSVGRWIGVEVWRPPAWMQRHFERERRRRAALLEPALRDMVGTVRG